MKLRHCRQENQEDQGKNPQPHRLLGRRSGRTGVARWIRRRQSPIVVGRRDGRIRRQANVLRPIRDHRAADGAEGGEGTRHRRGPDSQRAALHGVHRQPLVRR